MDALNELSLEQAVRLRAVELSDLLSAERIAKYVLDGAQSEQAKNDSAHVRIFLTFAPTTLKALNSSIGWNGIKLVDDGQGGQTLQVSR